MNNLLGCTSGLLQSNYRAQGQQALNHRQQCVQQLLSQRQLPPNGWNDAYIQALLGEIAMMDSNNFIATVGVGEREGRVFSSLVRTRHSNLSHGMGRSGDLLAQQPKAAGSSLLLTLTHALTLHAIKLAGLTEAKQVLLLPVATGMSIVLTLTAIKQQHPTHLRAQKEALQYAQLVMNSLTSSTAAPSAATIPSVPVTSSAPLYVIWSRIDQKTCLKSIFAAGLIPVVIELKQEGDQLVTDVPAIEAAIDRLGAENVLAVVSTTSCFAPRVPDRVVEIGKLCAARSIAHVINNAYGLQSASTCALLNSVVRKRGRVDAVISSMDKNFMVPVGGAMVIGFQQKEQQKGGGGNNKSSASTKPLQVHTTQTSSSPLAAASPSTTPAFSASPSSPASLPNVLNLISSLYPGRASSSSITDLFITLLAMGQDGWIGLLKNREELLPKFKARLAQLAEQHGERLLQTDDNSISFAMTLDQLVAEPASASLDPSLVSPPSEHKHDDGASDSGSSVSVGSNSVAAHPSTSSKGEKTKFVPSYLGSLLFSRNVSGPRVLAADCAAAKINGITFQHYGTHSNHYLHSYVTAACGIGMEEREVEVFAQRLEKCMKEFQKQRGKGASRPSTSQREKSEAAATMSPTSPVPAAAISTPAPQ